MSVTPKPDTSQPLNEKLCLTVNEAARYSGIGVNQLSRMLNEPDCSFVLRIGRRRMIKREAFEAYIKSVREI